MRFYYLMADDDIKKLNPEDRVRKLKEIADKKKKEIEEAQKEIKEAEVELSEKLKKKERVPIPEVAKEDVEGLSETAQAILKEQRGISSKKAVSKEDDLDEKNNLALEVKGKERDISLEETVMQEKVRFHTANVDYSQQLSQKPMAHLYQEMTAINKAVEDKGYINPSEQQRVQYLTSAVEKKLEAVEAGIYSLNEEVARAALLTQQLGGSLSGMYKDNRKTGKGNEWYKSG